MCGRFTITLTKEDFINYLSTYDDIHIDLDHIVLPNYNVAPSENVVAMISHKDQYRVGPLKWGFIPSFAKDIKSGFKMINARAETLLDKLAFKDAIISKRCVIFADSFYEWKKEDHKKIPMRIKLIDQEIFAFAGLYSTYKDKEQTIHSATIITTQSNEFMTSIHHRMPVILKKDDIEVWLNPKTIHAISYLKPYDTNKMKAYEVSNYVNNASHKGKNCIEEIKNTN